MIIKKILTFLSPFIFIIPLTYCSDKQVKDNTENQTNMRNDYTINNIKEEYIIKYNYQFGEIDTTKIDTINIKQFDRNGNLISEKNPLAKDDFPPYKILYNYQDTCLVSVKKYDTNGKILERNRYAYKENNVIDSLFDKSGDLESITLTYKNRKGSDSIKLTYSKDNTIIKKDEFIYDSQNRLITSIYNDILSPSYSYSLNREYIDDETVRTTAKRLNSNQIFDTDISLFNQDGLIQSYERTTSDNDYHSYVKCTYKYIENTNLIEERLFTDKEGEAKYIHKYFYNKF